MFQPVIKEADKTRSIVAVVIALVGKTNASELVVLHSEGVVNSAAFCADMARVLAPTEPDPPSDQNVLPAQKHMWPRELASVLHSANKAVLTLQNREHSEHLQVIVLLAAGTADKSRRKALFLNVHHQMTFARNEIMFRALFDAHPHGSASSVAFTSVSLPRLPPALAASIERAHFDFFRALERALSDAFYHG